MIHVSLHSDLNQFQIFQRFRTGSNFDNENNTYNQLLPDLPTDTYLSLLLSPLITTTTANPPLGGFDPPKGSDPHFVNPR